MSNCGNSSWPRFWKEQQVRLGHKRTGYPMDCTDSTSVINRNCKRCNGAHTPRKIKADWQYHWFWQWFESSLVKTGCLYTKRMISMTLGSNNSTHVVNWSTSGSTSSRLEETSLKFLSNPCFDCSKLDQDGIRGGRWILSRTKSFHVSSSSFSVWSW